MTDRIPLDAMNSDQLDKLYDRLDRAETFVTTVAEIIADHAGDEWATHPATMAIRRGFGTVPHAAGDPELRRQLDAAIKALGGAEAENAELRRRITVLEQVDASNKRHVRTIIAELESADRARAEAQHDRDQHAATLERVHALADRWVKAGPPPIGQSLSRWWDTRLAELHAALNPPKEH